MLSICYHARAKGFLVVQLVSALPHYGMIIEGGTEQCPPDDCLHRETCLCKLKIIFWDCRTASLDQTCIGRALGKRNPYRREFHGLAGFWTGRM